jgi:hypothetical protein
VATREPRLCKLCSRELAPNNTNGKCWFCMEDAAIARESCAYCRASTKVVGDMTRRIRPRLEPCFECGGEHSTCSLCRKTMLGVRGALGKTRVALIRCPR